MDSRNKSINELYRVLDSNNFLQMKKSMICILAPIQQKT